MTKDQLRQIAAQAVSQAPITKVREGVRSYGEREMYLRTDAADYELDGEKIELSLARRQARMSPEQWAETKQQRMYEDRRARMGY
jgi:hypothetical protein